MLQHIHVHQDPDELCTLQSSVGENDKLALDSVRPDTYYKLYTLLSQYNGIAYSTRQAV